MYQQYPHASASSDSKNQAAFRLSNLKNKQRRVRHKRELVDLHFSSSQNFENLMTRVRGTQGWAKIAPGSVKIVKRLTPLNPQ